MKKLMAPLAGLALVTCVATARAADTRSYVAGNFAFNLEGVKTGFLRSVDGGAISAEVIPEHVAGTTLVAKHIGQPKYEDFELQLGFSMAPEIYDWISASWNSNFARKNGAIVAADYKLDAKSEREFFNALITETTIPACDAASKDPAFLSIRFSPEFTRFSKASGKISTEAGKSTQKTWLPANFRLEIDGIDCSKVSKIESFTVKQTVVDSPTGNSRDYQKEPATLEFPNLTITFSEGSAQTWRDWHDDFVIKGNNGSDREKKGRLILLSPNRQEELVVITFHNLGIFRLTNDKQQANGDAAAKVTAELYCEKMDFAAGQRIK
jgi:hypothetical protein